METKCETCEHCSHFIHEQDVVTLNIKFLNACETPYIGMFGANCSKLNMVGIIGVEECDGYKKKK